MGGPLADVGFGPSRLGLGTAPLGSIEDGPLWWGPQDRHVAIRTVRAAAEAGAAFVDTAPFYGWGRAEEIVGEALAGSDRRPPILTKCGTMRARDGKVVEDASPGSIRADVERSRRRLGVDRIDVVQIHDPDPETPIERSWEELMRLRDEGVIGGAGLSNHDVATMERAIAVGPVAVVQHQYSPVSRAPETDGVLDWCRERDVPFLAWSPLASGFLTGELRLDELHPDDLRHRLRWAGSDAAAVARVVGAARAIADRRGCTVPQVVLAWVTRFDGVRAIVGARTPAEARIAGIELPVLDADEVASIDG
jgi:aryl-alcohol dehydrogenase-like predicted oxidoreductase